MRTASLFVLLLAACASTPAPAPAPAPAPDSVSKPAEPVVEDPYLWLEDVGGDKALAWAKERNATSQKELESVATFAPTRDRLKSIYDSKDKIPSPDVKGKYIYNFWKDAVATTWAKRFRSFRTSPTKSRISSNVAPTLEHLKRWMSRL